MIDENLLGYFPFNDPNHTQSYIRAMNAMKTIDRSIDNLPYHHSILDDDNVDDSIKARVLYNELMSLKTKFTVAERRIMGEINYLNADHRRLVEENKKLSDEIASIKQALYFG